MLFEMKSVNNGYLMKVTDEALRLNESFVYQDTENFDVDCFAEFMWLLNEQFGPQTGPYSKKRIYITVEPGDKYEEN